MMTYLTGIYGLPPQANLTFVETEDGAANGYATPGLVFLSPQGIGKQVAVRLLTNQIARQWWTVLVSPATRSHMWLTNGMARYSEVLYLEHTNGAFGARIRDQGSRYRRAHDERRADQPDAPAR